MPREDRRGRLYNQNHPQPPTEAAHLAFSSRLGCLDSAHGGGPTRLGTKFVSGRSLCRTSIMGAAHGPPEVRSPDFGPEKGRSQRGLRTWTIFRFPAFRLRSRCSRSRHADRAGTSNIGSAAEVGARKTEHRPIPRHGRPSSCPNPEDRTSGQPWTTPRIDVLCRDHLEHPPGHNQERMADGLANLDGGCQMRRRTSR